MALTKIRSRDSSLPSVTETDVEKATTTTTTHELDFAEIGLCRGLRNAKLKRNAKLDKSVVFGVLVDDNLVEIKISTRLGTE